LRHDVPFLPELPTRGDAMLDYIKEPGRLSCLREFQAATAGREIVKVQCVGPATLAMGGYAVEEAELRVYLHLLAILEGLQVGRVLVFLDEPALGHVGFRFEDSWREVLSHLSEFPIVPAVHTCGPMDWDRLFASDMELISHDAARYDVTRYRRYRMGKRIAWGITSAGDVRDCQPGDLVTPPCGMHPRSFTVDDAERQLAVLNECARTLRAP
jgi:hypothetical protein